MLGTKQPRIASVGIAPLPQHKGQTYSKGLDAAIRKQAAL